MSFESADVVRSALTLSAHCVTAGDRAAIAAAVRKRDLVLVTRGAYLPAGIWAAAGPADRYRMHVIAAAEVQAARGDSDFVASHLSAAALWRLPWTGDWPTAAHVVIGVRSGGRSNSSIVRHASPVPDRLQSIDGLAVTDLARTVVDVAACSSFRQSVVLADAALRRSAHPAPGVPRTVLTTSELLREAEGVPLRRGSARVRAVAGFASGMADRPGESHSRVSILLARLPAPVLQAELFGASGRRYFADFWWPECGHIGEFDGQSKYSDPEFLRGRTPHKVLLDEKAREDDLRAANYGFSRWGWEMALSPARLGELLRRAGIR